MSSNGTPHKLEKWNRLQAWLRGGAEGLFNAHEGIASCVCDAVPVMDRLRMLGRYLVVSLAQFVPVSPVKIWLLRRVGVKIGRDVYISPGVVFDPLFPELITIEDGVLLGLCCRLITHEYTTKNFRLGRVHIGRDSVIGGWALVRSGVRIGTGVTVGACCFVYKDVPDGATVISVPGRVLHEKAESEE